MSERKNRQPEAVVKVTLPDSKAQLYWARLSRLVQLRGEIDTNLQGLSTSGTFNFYREQSQNEENSQTTGGFVNIIPTEVKPYQYSPGLRRGVLHGIYSSWRQLTDMGYGDLADTIVKYDRDKQGIHPGNGFKPSDKRKR